VAVYVNALPNPFVYDDHRVVVDNRSPVPPLYLRALLFHAASRPVVNLSYALDRAIWGPEPLGFHLTNVLLHALNAALLALVARGFGTTVRRPAVVALVASLVFAAHPMMTASVGYISGRAEVLCGTFFLLALLCVRRATGLGSRWGVLTVMCWLLALGSKEVAVAFPIVALALDRWTGDGDPCHRRARWRRLHAPLFGLAAAGIAARLGVFVWLEHRGGGVRPQWPLALVELDVVRQYTRMLLVPRDQSIFHAVSPVPSVTSPRALAGAATVVAMLGAAWAWRRTSGLASAGLVWFLAALVPSIALVLLDRGEPMAEHRVYLASCGLFLTVGMAVEGVDRWLAGTRVARRVFRVALPVLLALLVARTIVRNATWSDPVLLWTEASMAAPDHWLPYVPLGEALHAAGRHGEAVPALATAVRLRPEEPAAYRTLGLCLVETGAIAAAVATFERLETLAPDAWEAPAGLALVAIARGDTARAQLLLAEARSRRSSDDAARRTLDDLAARITSADSRP